MYLSGTGAARRNAIRIMANYANNDLSDRRSSLSGRETAVSALLAIDWTSDLAREVGSRPLDRLPCRLRNEEFPGDEYRIFADTIDHASGESNPIAHPILLLWKAMIIRYHLFEAADATHRISLIAKLDTRGTRSPPCLAGFAFSDICAMGWQIPEPDLLTWLWQAARQDASPYHLAAPISGQKVHRAFRT